MKLETYCPIFSGFYGSEAEYKYNTMYSNEEDEDWIPYDEYISEVASKFVDKINTILNEDAEIPLSMKYQKVVSPKYYNFENDSINVEINISPKGIDIIKDTMNLNKGNISDIIKRDYTSRDGFLSSYSNSFDDWMEYLEDVENQKPHILGAVLGFILEAFEIEEDEVMNEILY